MDTRPIWEPSPDSVAISDPLEGLDIYDALSEGLIDLDDLPVPERLTAEEQQAEEESNKRFAAELAESDAVYEEF